MEGEVNHTGGNRVGQRFAERTPIPGGLVASEDEEVCKPRRSGSSYPAEVNASRCVVSFQHLTSGSDETLLTHKYKLKIPHMLRMSTITWPFNRKDLTLLHSKIKIDRFVVSSSLC